MRRHQQTPRGAVGATTTIYPALSLLVRKLSTTVRTAMSLPLPSSTVPSEAAALEVEYDVLIIGGGPAGLAAATTLESLGITSYLIVEARGRLGGRAFTDHSHGGHPVDLGASWIHHYGPSNPMTQLLWSRGRAVAGTRKGGCDVWMHADGREEIGTEDFHAGTEAYEKLMELNSQFQFEHSTQQHPAAPINQFTYQEYMAALQQGHKSSIQSKLDVTTCLDADTSPPALAACLNTDVSFDSFLQSKAAQSISNSLSPTAHGIFDAIALDIEAYEGATVEQLSAAHVGEELAGIPDCNMAVATGYGRMLQDHAEEARLHYVLHTVVDVIDYSHPDMVIVRARLLQPDQQPLSSHGSTAAPNQQPHSPDLPDRSVGRPVTYRCRFCLVTVPLGVLKRPELLTFTPHLPEWKLSAIRRMGFGLLNKVVLEFDQQWWKEEDMNILSILTPLKQDEQSNPEKDSKSLSASHPLWIVNLSPLLRHSAQVLDEQLQDRLIKHGPAWRSYMQSSAPLMPVYQCQEEELLVGEDATCSSQEQLRHHSVAADTTNGSGGTNHHFTKVADTLTSSEPIPRELPPSPSAAGSHPSSASAPRNGPHVLVSFVQTFDSEKNSRSTHESMSDDEIVQQLMERLRCAFLGSNHSEQHQADSALTEVHSLTVRTIPRTAASTIIHAEGDASIAVPNSFMYPLAKVFTHSHSVSKGSSAMGSYVASPTALSRSIPSPIRYTVTRWGLEPYSHGAYSHYPIGSGGAATCADLARPVCANEKVGVPRLLFAGEATCGVHLGCVDSAWISGVREAHRAQQMLGR